MKSPNFSICHLMAPYSVGIVAAQSQFPKRYMMPFTGRTRQFLMAACLLVSSGGLLLSTAAQQTASSTAEIRANVDTVRSRVVSNNAADSSAPPLGFTQLPPAVRDNAAAQKMRSDLTKKQQQESSVRVVNGTTVLPRTDVLNAPAAGGASRASSGIGETVANAQKISAIYGQVRHDLIYSDPELKALNDEIVQIEKQLNAKRASLEARLSSRPEMQQADGERRKAFEAVMDARKQGASTAAGVR